MNYLAAEVDGHCCLSPLMYKAKAHSRCGRDIVGSERCNGNCNSSPMFLFSVWGHLRIPRVSKNMDVSCNRKSNNGKRENQETNMTDSQ